MEAAKRERMAQSLFKLKLDLVGSTSTIGVVPGTLLGEEGCNLSKARVTVRPGDNSCAKYVTNNVTNYFCNERLRSEEPKLNLAQGSIFLGIIPLRSSCKVLAYATMTLPVITGVSPNTYFEVLKIQCILTS